MSVSIIYILLILAAVIIIAGIIAYNKRLDRIASGEIHDTHSSIPEPKTTVGVTYRVILIVLAALTFFGVSSLNGTVTTLQSNINNLQSTQQQLYNEIYDLRSQLDAAGRSVSSFTWNRRSIDFEARSAEVEFTAALNSFTDGTSVALILNGKELPLERKGAGTFTGRYTLKLFETYIQPTVCISDNGSSVTETVDFPEDLFWDLLPMPSYFCRFSSKEALGSRLKYEGEYTVETSQQEDIASVSITYLTGGKELKTMDITKEVLAGEAITLEKELPLEHDLTFRLEILTYSGFKIVDRTVMIYEDTYTTYSSGETDGLQIFDRNGDPVWENDYK